ncbi:MAG: hypothetical protein AAF790_05300 [Planctomycetota bacterium]
MPAEPISPLLPAWFRGLLIAAVMIMLCSCTAVPVRWDASVDALAASMERGGNGQNAGDPESGDDPSRSTLKLVGHDAAAGSNALECQPLGPGCSPNGCGINAACGTAGCAVRGPIDEYLCDGGDCGPPVGVRGDWSIDGLEQEDTVAHYDTVDGRVLVTPSNRVCIYAPRFGAVRRVVNASESLNRELINVFEDDMALAVAEREDLASTTLQQVPPVTKIGENPAGLLINRQQPGEFEARVVIRELRDLIKPYCNLKIIRLGVIDNTEKPWLASATVAARTWTADQAAQVTINARTATLMRGTVTPGVMYAGEGGKPCLRLVKLASASHAAPGDEISFTLRFDNVGTQEIGNVTIVDNLTTRLQYVDDSAEASVDAQFSSSENGAGSLILRWEITQPVKPGEGGVLQFRVRVR